MGIFLNELPNQLNVDLGKHGNWASIFVNPWLDNRGFTVFYGIFVNLFKLSFYKYEIR
jgi:hypothetical protein